MNRHDNYRWKVRASVCSKPSMVASDGSCHRQSTWLQRHQGCLHRTTDERSRNRLPYREQAYRETESGAAIAKWTTEVLAVGTRCGGEYVVASWQTDIGQAVNSTLLAHSHRNHGCANADILTSKRASMLAFERGLMGQPDRRVPSPQFAVVSRRRISP
jgi:hypothetical protein